jgi:hypothetical protein
MPNSEDDPIKAFSLQVAEWTRQNEERRFNEHWKLVDSFTIFQATFLWCGVEPIPGYSEFSRDKVPAQFHAILAMLLGEARRLNPQSDIFTLSLSTNGNKVMTRDALLAFAERKKLYPNFLFDTAASEDGEPHTNPPKSRVGAPEQYNWDLMYAEVLRHADLDGLPARQADLVRYIENWFRNGMTHIPSNTDHGSPSEVTLKRRIGPLYYNLRRLGWEPSTGS